MDDLKISHVHPTVVDVELQCLKEQYGKFTLYKTTQGKVKNYQGMLMCFRKKGKVKVIITKNSQITPEIALMDMGGLEETPTTNHLFQVSEDSGKLLENKQEVFQTLAAKIIFVICWSQTNTKQT